jgi:hypothetical protein
MATINSKLTLSGTNLTSNALSLAVSDSLTVANPITGLSRESVLHTGETVLIASSVSADTYIYIKNTDSTNFVDVKTDAGTTFAELSAGEAVFFCAKGSQGIEVQADTASVVVEYATFTKG